MSSEDLASSAVYETLRLGGRIAAAPPTGPDLQPWLTSELGPGAGLSKEMIQFATSHVGEVSSLAVANKLAFLILSTQPDAPAARLIEAIAAKTFARSAAALAPYMELGDLVSLLRWRLWSLSPEQFTSERVLKHPGIAAYISVIARRLVIDECRALTSRARAGAKVTHVDVTIDPRSVIDTVLDDLDVLQRVTQELPSWQRALVPVLLDHSDREAALDSINRDRQEAGLAPWTMESLRTSLHRLRVRVREALAETPPLPVPSLASPTGSDVADGKVTAKATVVMKQRPRPTNAVVGARKHTWKRFWQPRDKSDSASDAGFLADPESEYGRYLLPHAASLEQMEAIECLVLLGDPGMGKSTTLLQERERISVSGSSVSSLDLARTDAIADLERIMGSERDLAQPLFVLLDGLDEGIARNAGLVEQLGESLRRCNRSNLRLRISCRSLEWPALLEARLRELWPGADAVKLYELLPLRRTDVQLAASDYEIDPRVFIDAVVHRDATGLAIHPLSLRFLLELYSREGTLPHSKLRLFAEGTLILCSEESTWQRGSGRANADAFRRRVVASRIAAVGTFTNRLSVTRRTAAEAAIELSEIVGGTEAVEGARYEVNTQALDDAVSGTALFSAGAEDSFTWTHQSYREFLAAWYLGQRDLDIEIVVSLYFPSGDATQVPGPLREVAAWHATLVPALFDLLITRDPDVLMRSDSAAISPALRRQLTEALLRRMAAFEALDSGYWENTYRRLAHPDLADQLRPYIRDPSNNVVARRAAMNIAWSCTVVELVPDLGALLEDEAEDIHIRERAAFALSRLNTDEARAFLISALTGSLVADVRDGIRGAALQCLWPAHVPVDQLFDSITAEKNPHYSGAYANFLRTLPSGLPAMALPAALAWVDRMGERPDYDSIGSVQAGIISLACEHLEQPQVSTGVARILAKSLPAGFSIIGYYSERVARKLTTDRRRVILLELIKLDPRDEDLAAQAASCHPPLLSPEDLSWLSEASLTTNDTTLQAAFARCVRVLYAWFDYPTDPQIADLVIQAAFRSPAFQEVLSGFLLPIDLTSSDAERLQSEWKERQESARRQVARKDAERTLEREQNEAWLRMAREELTRMETDQINRWPSFYRAMIGNRWLAIQNTPNWQLLVAEQERIVRMAIAFLESTSAPSPEWMENNELPGAVIAARAALILVAGIEPSILSSLSEHVWQSWGVVTVAIAMPTCTADVLDDLRRRVYTRGLAGVIEATRRIARREDRDHGMVNVFDQLLLPWPEALQIDVLTWVDELGDQGYEAAMVALLASGSAAARERALSTMATGSAPRAACAASAILPVEVVQWGRMLDRMDSDKAFAHAMGTALARETRDWKLFESTDYLQIARLITILFRSFPTETDPDRDRSTRSAIADLCNGLIEMLTRRGTRSALNAIAWLIDQVPTRLSLRWQLIRAREAHSLASWRPPSILEFLRVVRALGVVVLHDAGVGCSLIFDANGRDPQRIADFLQTNIPGCKVGTKGPTMIFEGATEVVARLTEFAEAGLINEATAGGKLLGIRLRDEWLFEAIPLTQWRQRDLRDASVADLKSLLERIEVVVATATDVETDAVLSAMEPLPGEERLIEGSVDVSTYRVGMLGRYLVAHLQSDMGSSGPNSSQLALSDVIRDIDPAVIFMIGIAFGLKRAKQRLGDVLLGEHITGYEMVKLHPGSIDDRGWRISGSVVLRERLNIRKRDWVFQRADGTQVDVISGQVLSGEKLVNSKEFRDELLARFPAAIGGEMEAIGGYSAAQRHRTEILLVKSICDWADGLKNDRAQAFAASTATSIVRHVLGKRDALASLGVSEHVAPASSQTQ